MSVLTTDFSDQTACRQLKVAVLGLGYVGLPLAVAFSRHLSVIGFDVNRKRVNELRDHVDVSGEVDTGQLSAAKNLEYFSDDEALAQCDVYVVAVPTPVSKSKQPDLEPVRKATETVAKHLSPGNVVIYESTVYPGLTEETCIPILESGSGLQCAFADVDVDSKHHFYVGYSPERVSPGDKNRTLEQVVKVVSGSNQSTLNFIQGFYDLIVKAGTYAAPSIQVAEAAKVIENIQRDVNIALVNELSVIFEKMGISTRDVLAAAGTKWNFHPFTPGLVGGHCIGVDPYYLAHRALEIGHNPEIILVGRRVNESMVDNVVNRVIERMLGNDINILESRVLLLGVTFKENCPDTRNSKAIELARKLSQLGVRLDVFDPIVDASDVADDIRDIMVERPDTGAYEAVVVAVAHDAFKLAGLAEVKSFLAQDGFIFDVKWAFDSDDQVVSL